MNIQEATKKAMERNCYIAREIMENGNAYLPTAIKPTNSYARCIIYTFDRQGKEIHHCKNWEPTADDLIADDWVLIKK